MKKLLISVMGPDQPGILAAVSGVISERGGNIENLSQTLLQSVFGGLLVISVPDEETPEGLQQALVQACSELQLHIDVHPAFERKPGATPEVQPYIVAAMGPDRQGLVAALAGTLARHDVNITNMQAIFKGGSKPLDNMMIFEVDVPRHAVMQDLRDDLNEISRQKSLEISVQHRKIFESVSNLQN